MEADGGPSLAVAFLARAVPKKSGDPSCVALLCPKLISPFGARGRSWGALSGQQMLPQGTECWGCWSSYAPEMPPAAGGLTKHHKDQGEFGPAVQCLPLERSRQSAIRKRSRHPPPPFQPSRNALIGLMKAKHTACNIYKWLIRQRNRSAGLKTLGT